MTTDAPSTSTDADHDHDDDDGAGVGGVAAASDLQTEMVKIHQENQSKLQAMPVSEISSLQQEIFAALGR